MTWTPEALAAALGVLSTAVFAVAIGAARTYGQVVNLVEGVNRAGIAVRGARGQAGGGASNGVVARRVSNPVPTLLPVEPVNQMAGVTVSSSAAPTGPVDCGPACVVSTIEEMKGCWSADELLRLRYFGVVDSRLTTAEDLVGMLRANGIAAHAQYVDWPTAQIEIVRNWQAGRPSLVLGAWVSRGYGHWMKFLGDRGGPQFMNPWPNGRQAWTWHELEVLYSGAYVHVDGQADAAPVA